MKNVFCFLGAILCLHAISAQKVIKKALVNPNISFIQIDVENCFEIELDTSAKDEMLIEAYIDGEYKKDLLLHVTEEGSTIKVSAGFQPNFVSPNDKLSAHKVVSIALKIVLPQQKDVQVFGTNCNVRATGAYSHLKVTLDDGRCDLMSISETAEVTTQSGNITANYSQAHVRAKSKYGKVTGDASPEGNNQYTLNTVTGNILLKRVE